MTGSDLTVALDLGTTKVLTLVGALAGDRLQILGAGTAPSAGVVKGVIVDLEEAASAIRDSVAAAERAAIRSRIWRRITERLRKIRPPSVTTAAR